MSGCNIWIAGNTVLSRLSSAMYPEEVAPSGTVLSGGYLLKKILSPSKHRRWISTALVRRTPDTLDIERWDDQ